MRLQLLLSALLITMAVQPVIAQTDTSRSQSLDELTTNAERLYRQNNFAESKAAFEKVLAASRAAGDKKLIAFSLNGLALIAEAEKRFDDAEALFKEALATKQAAVGDESAELMPLIMNLGRLKQSQRKLDEAQVLFERAVAIGRRDTKSNPAELGVALTSLAHVIADKGDAAKAEDLLRQALQQIQKGLGDANPATIKAKSNLAALLSRNDKQEEATKLYREVVESYRKTGDKTEPYAAALTNLAGVLRKQQKFEEADPYAREAVAVMEQVSSPDPKRLITAESNLAKLLIEESQFDESRKLFEKVLTQIDTVYGESSQRAMEPLTDLSALASITGDSARAISLLQRVVDIGNKALPADSPDVTTAISNLANAYRENKQYDKALALYTDVVERQKRIHGEISKETADALDDIALMAREQGQAAAEDTFKKVIEIREKLSSQDPAALGTSLNNLAKLYRDQGKFDEAEKLFQRALVVRERTFGPKDASVAATLRNYAVLLRKKGDKGKADELDARAESIEGP